jgi:WD40 repeat protein
VNPDGTRVALSAFQDRVVEAWDRTDGAQLAQLANTSPQDVRWSPDGRLVHSSNDGSIRLVTMDGERDELVLRGHRDGVTYTALTADGEALASISWAGELRTWDLTSSGPAELGNLSVAGRVGPFVVSPSGDQAAVSVHLPSELARIDLVDLRDRTVSTLVDGLRSPAYHWPTIAGDHRSAAGLDEDLRGHVYDLPSGESRLELPPCQSPKTISHDGSRLVVEGNLLCAHERYRQLPEPPPGAVLRSSVIDAHSGAILYDLGERPLNGAALGPSGTPFERYVALLVDWQTVELHDLDAGRLIGELDIEPEQSTTIWFSDDGRHLVFGTQSGQVTLLDVDAAVNGLALDDAISWSFQDPSGSVVTVPAIAGGRLATSSFAGHVRVYDLADRRLLVDLPIEPLGVPRVAFSADATAIHYTDGQTIRRFELDLDRLEALARSRLTRDRLTDEECRQYRIDRAPCPPLENG